MRKRSILTFVTLLLSSTAWAHVTIWPRESQAGGSEKYVVRVPTEGKVTTTAVEIEVPQGVNVVSVGAPAGWTYELKRDGNRITSITWKMDIKPGEFAEFAFLARNPRTAEIAWKAHQRFADGTSSDWIGGPGERNAGPVTKLTPAAPSSR